LELQPATQIRAIDQSRLGDEVAEMLRRAILVGELTPGTHLVESVLSAQFDVSRGPIREALRELEGEGLVEARRRGVFVTGLTRDDVWELYTLRAAIDLVAIDLAVASFTAEDFDYLDRLVGTMERAVAESRMADFAEADMAFHSAFYERSGNRRLLKTWQGLVRTFRVLIEITDVENPNVDSIVQEHREILEAARRGDTAALRARIGTSLDAALEIFQRRLPAKDPPTEAPLPPSAILDPGRARDAGAGGGESPESTADDR
jgi:GntR family transcriptional regulator of gluconate operon